MKIVFLVVCFLFTILAKAQYQNSLNALKKAKEQIEKVEEQEEARASEIERDTTTNKAQEDVKKDDLTQEEIKN